MGETMKFHEKSLPGKLRHIAAGLEECRPPLYWDDILEIANPDTLREMASEMEEVLS